MKKRNLLLQALVAMLSLSITGCDTPSDSNKDFDYDGGELNIQLNKAGYGQGWIEAAIEGFEKEYHIEVLVTETPDLASELTRVMDAKNSNDVSDLYFSGFELQKFLKWARVDGLLEPLEDLSCVSRLNSEIKEWGTVSVKGKEHLYAIHPNIVPETFIYNQDYLNKISSFGAYKQGEWPTSWQGLLDLCKQLVVNMDSKIDGTKVYPYAMYLADDFEPQKLYETLFAQGNGGQDYKNYWNFEIMHENPTSADKSVFVNDSYASAMWALDEFLQVDQLDGTNPKYYKNYQGGTGSSGDVEALSGFLKGEALFCWHGSFFGTEAEYLINSNKINKIGDSYRMGPVPAISGNEKDRTLNLNWPHETIVVPSFAPNKENAKKFIDYIYRDENLINIVRTMNAIPGFEHTYTQEELASLSRWGQDLISTYETFSNKEVYKNGISFRSSTSFLYRNAVLNSLNFNKAGEGIFFGYLHCSNSNYNKQSKEEYLTLLDELYEKGIKKKWSEWVENYYVGD